MTDLEIARVLLSNIGHVPGFVAEPPTDEIPEHVLVVDLSPYAVTHGMILEAAAYLRGAAIASHCRQFVRLPNRVPGAMGTVVTSPFSSLRLIRQHNISMDTDRLSAAIGLKA